MKLAISQAITLGKEKGVDLLDIQVILAHVLNKNRTHLLAWPEKILTDDQLSAFQALIVRRSAGEPVAYLIGYREFWSLPLMTNSATLIPRPDTEVLVEVVIDLYPQSPLKCVDLGTGTGAIALALKSERPAWQLVGVDVVAPAVELAQANAKSLGLHVEFQQGAWCDAFAKNSIDLIVTNPPYIDSLDPHLTQGDVMFEPKSALVSGHAGLADIEKIAEQAQVCLVAGGGLFIEHGWMQARDVQTILHRNGFYNVTTVKDYGDNDRVTYGYLIN